MAFDTCRAIRIAGRLSRRRGVGRLDVLVNNAGTTKLMSNGDLDGLSADDFQRVYAVNTIGPYAFHSRQYRLSRLYR
ncbi:NAD(P)-dependent dehydrogenase (short-subunit alcohol dehydrogenase family) [Bradyrhizobium sp. USDA 3051]